MPAWPPNFVVRLDDDEKANWTEARFVKSTGRRRERDIHAAEMNPESVTEVWFLYGIFYTTRTVQDWRRQLM